VNSVLVRYFAAARAAAGLPEERVDLSSAATVGELKAQLQSLHGQDLTGSWQCAASWSTVRWPVTTASAWPVRRGSTSFHRSPVDDVTGTPPTPPSRR